jgi:hypothetical protein
MSVHNTVVLFTLSLLSLVQVNQAVDVYAPLYWSGPHYFDEPFQLVNASVFSCGNNAPCCGSPPDPKGASPAVLIAIESNCPFLYPEEIAVLAHGKGYSAVGFVDTLVPLGALALTLWRKDSGPIPMFDIAPEDIRAVLKTNQSSFFEIKRNVYLESPYSTKIMAFEALIGIFNSLVLLFGFVSLYRRVKSTREGQTGKQRRSVISELTKPFNLVYALEFLICIARRKLSRLSLKALTSLSLQFLQS